MLFADLFFLYFFLPICFGAYYIAKTVKKKNIVLVIFSLIFYAWGEPVKILFLLFSVAVNYLLARLIDDDKKRGRSGKFFLVIALIFDIGMLGVFKYTDFLLGNINVLFGTSLQNTGIVMPLGISFFTFQIISYVVDVYWENVKVQKKFYKLLMYISMFPQLIAGPIVRYETIADEIDRRTITVTDISAGITRLIIGLSKKVLLANTLNLVVKRLFVTVADGNGIPTDVLANPSVVASWAGALCYALQIYFDFSGYSDMAIGMGRMFGFHFDENFNYPFLCRSISEFWQRWHISLGSFFRDYLLYLPIFGKRRPLLSIFLVWFTTGLWHGASWNFVIWGLYFGVFVFIESKIGKKKLKATPGILMHLYSKIVIIIGFGIFYFEDLGNLGHFLTGLIGLNGNEFINEGTITVLRDYSYVIIVSIIASFPVAPLLKKLTDKLGYSGKSFGQVVTTAVCAVLLFISTAVLVDTFATNNPFVYFRF